jgi:hypothetical protein
MAQETIEKINRQLQNANITAAQKKELQVLLATLKNEIKVLEKTNNEDARSIVGFTEISAHEATKTEKNPDLMDAALKGLNYSVKEFEVTHPELVRIVNSISIMLSNIGI